MVIQRQFQHQLLTCGKPIEDKHSTVLQLLTKFACDYQSSIDGTGNIFDESISPLERLFR